MIPVDPEFLKNLIEVFKDVNGPREIPDHWCDEYAEWQRAMYGIYDLLIQYDSQSLVVDGELPAGAKVKCPACRGNCHFVTAENKDYPDGSYRWTEFEDCDLCRGAGKVYALLPLDNSLAQA